MKLTLFTATAALTLGSIHGVAAATSHIPVIGATASSGTAPVPYRQDINVLAAAGGPTWDLYVQALTAMFNTDDHNPLSYFQIAGIHGLPYIDWNNSGPKFGTDFLGFCPHNENLFGPWHRPFVLLFEQVLVQLAQNISNTYPANYVAQYQAAATNLRSPFWDWGVAQGVPAVTALANVTINVPDGSSGNLKQVNVTNPLYSYTYPQNAINGVYGSFPSNPRTTRCTGKGQTYPASANKALSKRPYKQWVYDAFTLDTDFNDFMTTGSSGVSLEQIHNGIHYDACCGGQFVSVDTSAFDPLFFLHHTNVDRLYAYWQAIKPSAAAWTTPYNGSSRYGTAPGTLIKPTSPLKPFYQSNNQPYDSNAVVSYYKMGYTYDQLEYWAKNATQMQSDASALINRLYGSGSGNSKKRVRSAKRGIKEYTTRFFVDFHLELSEVERPSEVVMSIGGQQAGSAVLMMIPSSGIFHAGFTLDDAVIDSGVIRNLLRGDVLQQVQKKLKVEIVKLDGSTIDIRTVPSLHVELSQKNITALVHANELPDVLDSKWKTAIVGIPV